MYPPVLRSRLRSLAAKSRTVLAQTILYDREVRSTFDYESTSKLRQATSKGIPHGYQDIDLDALMHQDKSEDRSKALKAITHVIDSNERLLEAMIPFGMDEVFQIKILNPADPTQATGIYSLIKEFNDVTEEQIIKSCNDLTLYSDNNKT